MKGLEQRIQHRIGTQVNRVQALADGSLGGQHHHSILYLGVGLLVPAELKNTYVL